MAEFVMYLEAFVMLREALLGWRHADDEWLSRTAELLRSGQGSLVLGDGVSLTLVPDRTFAEDPDDVGLLAATCSFLRRQRLNRLQLGALERDLASLSCSPDRYVRCHARALVIVLAMEREARYPDGPVSARLDADRARLPERLKGRGAPRRAQDWITQALAEPWDCVTMSRVEAEHALELLAGNSGAGRSSLAPADELDASNSPATRLLGLVRKDSDDPFRPKQVVAALRAVVEQPPPVNRLPQLINELTDSRNFPGQLVAELDSTLVSLCPNPDLDASGEVSTRLALHFLTRHDKEPTDFTSLQNAYAYAFSAARTLTPGSPLWLRDAPTWATIFAHRISATADEGTSEALALLDQMDQHYRDDQPNYGQALLSSAGLASTLWEAAFVSGDSRRFEERNTAYWDRLVDHCFKKSNNELLSFAMQNASVANLRLRNKLLNEGSDPDEARKRAERAIALAEQALALEPEVRPWRGQLVLLNAQMGAVFDGSYSPELASAVEQFLRQIAETWQHRRRGFDPNAIVALLESPKISQISDRTFDLWLSIFRRLPAPGHSSKRWQQWITTCSMTLEGCEQRGRLLEAVGIVDQALVALRSVLPDINDKPALYISQGLSSSGAVIHCRGGDTGRAAALLELGATMRTAVKLRPPIAMVSGAPQTSKGSPATRPSSGLRVETHLQSRLTPRALAQISVRAGAVIVYLTAEKTTGLAIVQHPNKGLRHIWLPELTRARTDEWLDLINVSEATIDGDERGAVRGGRGGAPPTTESLQTILTSARAAVEPLSTVLADQTIPIQLIAIGATAGIPWSHALDNPVHVTPSVTLLDTALARDVATGPGVAITAPDPSVLAGFTFRDLPFARREGEWLHERMDFKHHTEHGATVETFTQALREPLAYLHLSIHADVDVNSWGDHAHLIFAGTPQSDYTDARTVTLDDISTSHPKHVFLAACFAGAPNRTLPDESIGFPTAFLMAGARTVIAPLWPVDDRDAWLLVRHYYVNLIRRRQPPALALRNAAHSVRDDPSATGDATWAAFVASGA